MKLKEIKNTIARKHHFQDWDEMLYIYRNTGEGDLDSLIGEVVSAILSFAADSANIKELYFYESMQLSSVHWGKEFYNGESKYIVDKESIIKSIEI